MSHRSPSGEAVELRSAASRPTEASLLHMELEGMLGRVAAGLTTAGDAKLLRALLSCAAVSAVICGGINEPRD